MCAAAADVSLQGLHDFWRTGIGIFLKQRHAAGNHSGSAVGALKRALIEERLLNGMKLAVLFETFNGDDGKYPYGAVVFDAGQHGSFAPQRSEWIEAFYKNVEDRMLNIYDGARLRAWRINDRQEQADWFDQMLARMQEARKTLRGFCVPEPAALRSLIETLTELVEACRGAHAFLA